MKNTVYKLLLAATLMVGACTSGKDNPADSHPGSGSVKGSPAKVPEDPKPADTSRQDSVEKK